MRVLTYKSCKEHCELYTEIHGSIAINSCQIKLAHKYVIFLSEVSIVIYKAGKHTGVVLIYTGVVLNQRVLIQLMILMQKSRWQCYNKYKTGNDLKLKT